MSPVREPLFGFAGAGAGFHPPPPLAPHPVETAGRAGFLSPVTLPEPAPQPVVMGLRFDPDGFPTVMVAFLFSDG
jgi:hypothetical protein